MEGQDELLGELDELEADDELLELGDGRAS